MPRLIGAAQTSVFQEALSNNYTSNSTFTAPATRDIELLVVAGGGGGGGNPSPGVHGGGGGAGTCGGTGGCGLSLCKPKLLIF